MIHLRSIRKREDDRSVEHYPFNIPVIRALESITFTSPVTIFVGENGSGKSTLLEAIACAAGSITVGSESVSSDRTLESVRTLAQSLQLVWNKRTHRGFFLRAEDFFGYVKNLEDMRETLEDDLQNVDIEYESRSQYAHDLAKTPYQGQLHGIKQSYGNGLDTRSHGESFLSLFRSRFVPGGLYLLDEPEAPLSPVSQLGLISLLKQMTTQDAQFIIATHSPILMAYPDALILDFDRIPPAPTAYADLEQVRLLRDFLNAPDSFLRHL